MNLGWMYAIFAGILAAQAAVVLLPSGWGWPSRLAAGLVTFPATGILIGVVTGLCFRYWN
jgi:hypothetical protein